MYEFPVGIIGAGKFGCTVAKLISKNADVLLFSRKQELVDKFNSTRKIRDIDFPDNVQGIASYAELTERCILIFPVVSSRNFRSMMKAISPHLRPEHILIHGTKGLDIKGTDNSISYGPINLSDVMTMSEVIKDESSVVRVGCLSGPNIAKEILEGQPSATVVASEFDEVIELGRKVLESDIFFVFGSRGLKGAELAGSFKNYIALGSGIVEGHGYGRNIQALLLTRGLREMIHISKRLGSEVNPFLGTAGIGDLFATATSKDSRNYTVGFRLANGETLDDIIASMDEVAEGVRTLAIANQIAHQLDTTAPITKFLYQVVFENLDFRQAMQSIMRYPFAPDVDFL